MKLRSLLYATAGSDYYGTSMVLTFYHGSSDGYRKCMNVIIMDYDALEANQTFSVTLTTSDDDVLVRNNMTTVTITDNDSKL